MDGPPMTMAKSMAPGASQNLELTSEMDEVIKRIQKRDYSESQVSKNVGGVMVINHEGIPLKTTLDNSTTVQYGGMVSQLAERAKSVVRDLDPTNELTFLRVKSIKHEVLVAPDKDFVLIVLQEAETEES